MCRLTSKNYEMKLPEESVLNDEFYFSDDLDDSSPPSSPVRDGDFSEYMWMEHEDEFDSAVLRQLEEEELIDECVTEMVFDEMDNDSGNSASDGIAAVSIQQDVNVTSSAELQTVSSPRSTNAGCSTSSSTSPSSSSSYRSNTTAHNGLSSHHAPSNTGNPSQSHTRRSVNSRLTNIRDGLAPNATTSVGGGVIVNGRHHSNTSTALNSHAVLSDGRSTQLPNGVAPSPSTLNPNAKEFFPSSPIDISRNGHPDGSSLH